MTPPRVLTTQIRTVGSIDASLDRTRFYFDLAPEQYSTDVLTIQGFAPIRPGTKLRITLEYIDEEGSDNAW